MLMKAWARLRANLFKQGFIFNYFWVKEYTKKGKLHMHIIIDANIPQKVIRHAWYLATKKTSYIIHMKTIDMDIYNVAGYMMKYMTKTIAQNEFKKGERRYGFSRYEGFKPVKIPPDKHYVFDYDPHDTDKLDISDIIKCIRDRASYEGGSPP